EPAPIRSNFPTLELNSIRSPKTRCLCGRLACEESFLEKDPHPLMHPALPEVHCDRSRDKCGRPSRRFSTGIVKARTLQKENRCLLCRRRSPSIADRLHARRLRTGKAHGHTRGLSSHDPLLIRLSVASIRYWARSRTPNI